MRGLLSRLDRRDFDYYASLTDEEKKGFKALITMRWLSAASSANDEELRLFLVNQVVNTSFFDLADHPELQFKLMASCGRGKAIRHDWIPMCKTVFQRSIVHEFLHDIYPSANAFEIDVIFGKLDRDALERLMQDRALLPDRTKALRNAFEKAEKTKKA